MGNVLESLHPSREENESQMEVHAKDLIQAMKASGTTEEDLEMRIAELRTQGATSSWSVLFVRPHPFSY